MQQIVTLFPLAQNKTECSNSLTMVHETGLSVWSDITVALWEQLGIPRIYPVVGAVDTLQWNYYYRI